MTPFRMRILALMLFVFLAIPALAQENTTVASSLPGTASIGCLGVGVVALLAVGALMNARNAQDEQAATIPATAAEGVKKPE